MFLLYDTSFKTKLTLFQSSYIPRVGCWSPVTDCKVACVCGGYNFWTAFAQVTVPTCHTSRYIGLRLEHFVHYVCTRISVRSNYFKMYCVCYYTPVSIWLICYQLIMLFVSNSKLTTIIITTYGSKYFIYPQRFKQVL